MKVEKGQELKASVFVMARNYHSSLTFKTKTKDG
jgi:hypothetical protein